MQDPWSLVLTLLLAVVVGATLPVWFQLYLTLASTRRLIRDVTPKVNAILDEVKEASGTLNRATEGIDESAQRARTLFEEIGELGETMHRLNHSLKPAVMLGGAIGPALAVGIKTLLDRQSARQRNDPTGDSPPRDPSAAEPNIAESAEQGDA
jgi:hypothetical protein